MEGGDTTSLPISPGKVDALKKKKLEDAKKKQASTIGQLDHNNMSKSTSPQRKTAASRLLKTTNPPGLKNYPGDMRKIIKGTVTGAVYAEDIEKEEAQAQALYEAVYGVQKELTSEDLMRDAQYLKLDQSKLPLEIFDDIELASLDKTPQEWIESHSLGKAPYFQAGEWVWRAVQVFSYDEETKMFQVQYIPDGITKGVTRLNLQFDKEDAKLFKTRRDVAEKGREEAKQIMRLDHFITMQPKETSV